MDASPSPSPSPPDFTFHASLVEFTLPKTKWLSTHHKSFDGIATSALIFTNNNPRNRVLLVQRAPHDSMPNLWEPPGGAVDPSDPSILHACARELREETGLAARRFRRLVTEGLPPPPPPRHGQPPERWSVFTNSAGDKVFCSFAFEVEVERQRGGDDDDDVDVMLDPNEHQGWVWATEDEIRQGKMEDGRKLPLSCLMVRNRLMEAFRLRRLKSEGDDDDEEQEAEERQDSNVGEPDL